MKKSLPFASQAECDNNLPAFLSVVAAAFDSRFEAVRVSDAFDPGWYQIRLADNYYLRN